MKSLTLKEYDKIKRGDDEASNCFYKKEENNVYSLSPIYFDELKNYLLKKEKEETDKEEFRGGIVSFLKLSNHKRHGEILQIQHYVGIIELKNRFQIEVLPKIDIESNNINENEALERILLRMLGYLKDFPATPSNTANLNTSKTSLFEVFIQLYFSKVEELIKHGLKHRYVSVEENISSFKGSLNVMKQIIFNSADKHKFYIQHDEYLIDIPENRLIKSALLLLSDKTTNIKNGKKARQLLEIFEMVPKSADYLSDYSKIVYDRLNSSYHDVIEWSIAFLLEKSFIIQKGETAADSLLFPMEKIFESFVGKMLKKCLSNDSEFSDWNIKTQSTKKYLFDNPKKFQIRPDIRIFKTENKAEKNIILDTKWKRLDPSNEKRNFGISMADMYQMYAYAKRYKANDVWLIYPYSYEPEHQSLDGKEYKTIHDYPDQNKSIEIDTNVTIHLYFLDLSALSFKKQRDGLDNIRKQLNELLKKCLNE